MNEKLKKNLKRYAPAIVAAVVTGVVVAIYYQTRLNAMDKVIAEFEKGDNEYIAALEKDLDWYLENSIRFGKEIIREVKEEGRMAQYWINGNHQYFVTTEVDKELQARLDAERDALLKGH